jgi:hypothetical protein
MSASVVLAVGFVAMVGTGLILASCGGGDGDDYNDHEQPGAYTQGIWRGSVLLDGQNLGLLVGMIAESGRANLIYSGHGQLRGYVSSTGMTINTSFSALSLFGSSGDLSQVYFFLDGSVSPNSTLTANLMDSAKTRTLSLDLTYDSLYDRPASLSRISGRWTTTSPSGFYREWIIGSSGGMSGTDSYGCMYQGQIAIPNASHNLYDMSYQITGCYSVTVDVRGLAILDDTDSLEDTLVAAGTGATGLVHTSFVHELRRAP